MTKYWISKSHRKYADGASYAVYSILDSSLGKSVAECDTEPQAKALLRNLANGAQLSFDIPAVSGKVKQQTTLELE